MDRSMRKKIYFIAILAFLNSSGVVLAGNKLVTDVEDALDYIELASGYYKSGMVNAADDLEKAVLDFVDEYYGSYDLDFAELFDKIALVQALGKKDYQSAASFSDKAVNIYKTVLGEWNVDNYIESLISRCLYHHLAGNFDEVILYGVEATDLIKEFSHKVDKLAYTRLLPLIMHSYIQKGRHIEAIRFGEKEIESAKGLLERESDNYASFLNNLSICYSELGSYDEAIESLTRAVAISEKCGNAENVARFQNTLSLAYYGKGDYVKAFEFGRESVDKFKEIGKKTLSYAAALDNFGLMHVVIGKYDVAIELCEIALMIREELCSKEGPLYATSLNNLAVCYANAGRYVEAIELTREAADIRNEMYGEKSVYYLTSLQNLADYYFSNKDFIKAAELAVDATKSANLVVIENFKNLTGQERGLFWELNQMKSWYEHWLPEIVLETHTKDVVAAAYDGVLLSKGILLNSDIEMSRLLLESGDTAVVRLYKEMRTNRSIVNRQRENLFRLDGDAKAEMVEFIDSLAREADRQERELVARSKTFGDYTRNLAINWQDVRAKLGEGDIAVEFLEIPTVDNRVVYAAMTLKRGYDAPHFIVLFGKEQLDGLDNNFYFASPALYNMVWQPLAGELAGVENVYFAPAGELHRIAIEYAPVRDGEIFSDQYNAFRLTSTRQLAVTGDGRSGDGSAALYGGLRYDASPSVIASDSRKYSKASTVRSLDYVVPAVAADSLIARGSITELPATKTEIDSIKAIMDMNNIAVASFAGTLGTEASFKALSGQRKNMIHVATHGFYGKSDPEDIKTMMMPSLPVNRDRYVEDKAMTRSGLLFAGAANAWQMPDTIDNGILTAQEVAALDLRGLDLCVLSACETGLGEITGEGVFGLQRGFKKAGAKTLLVSLRPVYDGATSLLMAEFYRNYLSGKSKTESLREAQRYLRNFEVTLGGDSQYGNGSFKDRILKTHTSVANNRKVRPYSDPKYWAYFVLVDAL